MKNTFTLACCLSLSVLCSCFGDMLNATKSPAKTISKYENQKIAALDISSAFQVVVSQGDISSAVVEVPEVLVEYLVFELSAEGELQVGLKNLNHMRLKYDNGQLKLHVTSPDIKSITLSGACSASTDTPINVESLRLDLSGASCLETKHSINVQTDLNIEGSGASCLKLNDLRANAIAFDVSGACSVEAKGTVQKLGVVGSGASSLELDKLLANEVYCDISGATSVSVSGTEKISGEASGASSIKCFGGGKIAVKCSGASSASPY